jgi:hypothetical protein
MPKQKHAINVFYLHVEIYMYTNELAGNFMLKWQSFAVILSSVVHKEQKHYDFLLPLVVP